MEEPPHSPYAPATFLLMLLWTVRLYLFDTHAPFPHGAQAFIRISQFISLALTCTLPRLYLDITSSTPYPVSYDSAAALSLSVLYNWIDAVLVGRLRVAAYLLLQLAGADPRTMNGLEYCTVSILAWEMDMPLGIAYYFCNALELLVVHPISRFYTGAVATEIPTQMRACLRRGAIQYISIYIVRVWFPYYSYIAMLGATVVAIVWILCVQWINLFYYDQQLDGDAMRIDESGKLVYKALQTPQSFRLLRILPSVRQAAIVRCELHQVPFLEAAPNTYMTVSYL
ncbi:hypothetical protein IQ06DRAFT_381759 [Phaeosphaeriaceae sp. SRC1lsM3a]|nr:hypothetical protein IQ06DRAFT_381759 [Stagonospora sp. SRC1lsM3a]